MRDYRSFEFRRVPIRKSIMAPGIMVLFASLIIAPISASPGNTEEIELVEPPLPIAVLGQSGEDTFSGRFEVEDGRIALARKVEGDSTWIYEYSWESDRLVSVDLTMTNSQTGRSLNQRFLIDYFSDGRVRSQGRYHDGVELYSIQYKYDNVDVPSGATIYKRGQVIEEMEYEYGEVAWSRPVYLTNGFHFGQIRSYSVNRDDQRLFSTAAFGQKRWSLQSLEIHAAPASSMGEGYPRKVMRYGYE